MASRDPDLSALLEQSFVRPRSVHPPTGHVRQPIGASFKKWAASQVAAYRVGLVLSYFAMMYFGASAVVAGIPVFTFTAPEGYTPIWGSAVILGGLVASIGSLKAGTEPVTKEIKVFNRIELVGSMLLFLTLGTYAVTLLIIGYGYADPGRASVGSGFVALGVGPTVRMMWLIFRPRFIAAVSPTVPSGYKYALVPIEKDE